MSTNSRVKASRISFNHNQNLRVRTGLKAGALTVNHSQTLKVRSGLKAGLAFPGWGSDKDAQEDAERNG